MSSYADPELLVGRWINTELGVKVCVDPRLPHNAWATAPIAHIQRGAGFGAAALTLDDVTLDVDVYSAVADHARETAAEIWAAMTLQLPRLTLPGSIFVKKVECPMPPIWAPDPKIFRRSASYRLVLHGLLP
jgi:hypothetical protein